MKEHRLMTGIRFAFLSAVLVVNCAVAHGHIFSDSTASAGEPGQRPLLRALVTAQNLGFQPVLLAQMFDSSRWRPNLPSAAPELRGIQAPPRLPAKAAPRKAAPAAREVPPPLIVTLPKSNRAYERTFRILLARPELTSRYDELIAKYARQYHLETRLLKSIIAAESEFYRRALSPAGAMGLMQLLPSTAEEMGVPREFLYNPEYNIRAGASYIAHLFERAWRRFKLKGEFTDAPPWVLQRVIAAYHAGPKFLRSSWWYPKTRSYIRKVLLFYRSKVAEVGPQPGS